MGYKKISFKQKFIYWSTFYRFYNKVILNVKSNKLTRISSFPISNCRCQSKKRHLASLSVGNNQVISLVIKLFKTTIGQKETVAQLPR